MTFDPAAETATSLSKLVELRKARRISVPPPARHSRPTTAEITEPEREALDTKPEPSTPPAPTETKALQPTIDSIPNPSERHQPIGARAEVGNSAPSDAQHRNVDANDGTATGETPLLPPPAAEKTEPESLQALTIAVRTETNPTVPTPVESRNVPPVGPATEPTVLSTSPTPQYRPPSIAQYRNTSADLPLSLLEELNLRVLSEAAAGRRFVVRDQVETALMKLPVTGTSLKRLLDRHYGRLNFQVRPSDPDYKPSGRFGIRISESAVQRIALLRLEFLKQGMDVSLRDVLGIAIISALTIPT
jgi:hypothetical protein